jgi:hypothetical protein
MVYKFGYGSCIMQIIIGIDEEHSLLHTDPRIGMQTKYPAVGSITIIMIFDNSFANYYSRGLYI